MTRLLVATLHDADSRLYAQSTRLLPQIAQLYDGIAVVTTATTAQPSVELLRGYGAHVRHQSHDAPTGLPWLGRSRREALAFGVEVGADWLHFCDWDRLLHWAEYHPAELEQVAATLDRYDCTVHGRTARAFASHPRVQFDTEAIVNRVFELVSGCPWDVTAVSRGLSLQAAAFIATNSTDDSVGSDASWMLLLLREERFSMSYLQTEGLEFETADRYQDQIAAAGGLAAWIAAIDADPHQWALRLEVALLEVKSALAFAG